MKRFIPLLLLTLLAAPYTTHAQVAIGNEQAYNIDYLTPKQYEIGGIEFQGAERFDTRMLLMVSGLQVGDRINVPGDKIATAIDNLWRQGMFEDVKVTVTRVQGNTAFLRIILSERPRLSHLSVLGVSGDDQKKLKDDLHISPGDVVTENLIQTSTNIIRSYYLEKGFLNVAVNHEVAPDTTSTSSQVNLYFRVDKGKRVKIDSLIFVGNEEVPTRKLVSHMKNTHDVHYWKRMRFWTKAFWSRSKYRELDMENDLAEIINYYNELGYRDARIVSDTVFLIPQEELSLNSRKKAKQDRQKVIVKVHEGQKFYFRNITFTGNTIYSSEKLAKHLRIEKGMPYNKSTLETNLTYNPSGTDITSLYTDNGYVFFRATPVETAVEGDSIDIEIRIVEDKQARINNVSVEGNTVTNDKIIMRELHTRPGDLFSRDALLRSHRELATLGYFEEESLRPEPKPNAKTGTVDIVYHVTDKSTSQIQLQGGYGNGMFMGQVSLQLTNFSTRNLFNTKAWAPLPAGDGQKLGLSLTAYGSDYYSLSASFTEPWLGGRRPQSLGVYMHGTRISNGMYVKSDSEKYYSLDILGGGVSFGKRLKWPDDYFTLSHTISYRHYILNNYTSLQGVFTNGKANDLSYGITLARNSFDSPIYTRSGSEISIEGQITPPYSAMSGKDFSSEGNSELTSEELAQMRYRWIEYYKLNVKGSWNLNLIGDLVLNARFRFGYMGYFNQDKGLAPFGRYYIGGSGMNSIVLDGREIVPLRGYDDAFLYNSSGAGLVDRFTIELHQPIIESSASTIWLVGFFEGGNAWQRASDFQPFKMYNSAGVGVRFYMPLLGLIGVDWGYGFDDPTGKGGSRFHFCIGQSIE